MTTSEGGPAWVAALPGFPPPSLPKFTFGDEPEPTEDEPHAEEVRLAAVEEALGYRFQDRRLLRCALTSPGWAADNRHAWSGRWPSNKALEWLGDAVLYRVVTEHMVLSGNAACTGKSTPTRAKLVANERLAEVGEELGLWPHLYLTNGERGNNQATGRPRYMACAVEAIIGAVHLDAKVAGAGPVVVEELVSELLRLR